MIFWCAVLSVHGRRSLYRLIWYLVHTSTFLLLLLRLRNSCLPCLEKYTHSRGFASHTQGCQKRTSEWVFSLIGYNFSYWRGRKVSLQCFTMFSTSSRSQFLTMWSSVLQPYLLFHQDLTAIFDDGKPMALLLLCMEASPFPPRAQLSANTGRHTPQSPLHYCSQTPHRKLFPPLCFIRA